MARIYCRELSQRIYRFGQTRLHRIGLYRLFLPGNVGCNALGSRTPSIHLQEYQLGQYIIRSDTLPPKTQLCL
jgi:hypothetical protein